MKVKFKRDFFYWKKGDIVELNELDSENLKDHYDEVKEGEEAVNELDSENKETEADEKASKFKK